MTSISSSGSFDSTENFLQKMKNFNIEQLLTLAGIEGVVALSSATPKDSGLAASSWNYKIELTNTGVGVVWTNSDVETGFPVVIALQYGYATGTGGYVQGRDYINPAIQPIFDKLAEQIWREVTNG